MEQYGNMFEELVKELEQANRHLSKIVIVRKTSSEEISKLDISKSKEFGLKTSQIENAIRDNLLSLK